MRALLAVLPLAVVLAGMLLGGWTARRAGTAGLALALLLATTYGGGTAFEEIGFWDATVGAAAEAVFTTATILWIIFPALCLHHLQSLGGGLRTLQESLRRLSPDPRIGALLIAWFFALFMEGAAGFGAPVAVGAPLLLHLGVAAPAAVALAMVGHAAGVSFGAVGTPVVPQVAATGLTGLQISAATGLFHAALGWVLLLFLARGIRRSLPEGHAEGTPVSGWVAVAGVLFFVPFFLIARWVGPELPTLGGAAVGAGLFVALLRRHRRSAGDAPAAGGEHAEKSECGMLRAGAPYLILIGLILVTRLVPFIAEALRGVEWAWTLPGGFSGSVRPLYHPGTLLLASFLIAAAQYPRRGNPLPAAAGAALAQVLPVTLALLLMLMLARVMVHGGMIAELAAAATWVGAAWPLFAPAVGVLGTFVTGSATASNILFTEFQRSAAEGMALPLAPMIAAQGFGAAVGNIICPHNIIAGAATVGLHGREGEVLRRTLAPCLVYTALGGLLAFILVQVR
jgi:lactate permease